MTTLTPMRTQAYASFAGECVASYVTDNVRSHRWPEAGALERGRGEFDRILPQGLQTPGHFVYEIRDAAQVVGFLWYAVLENAGLRTGYVYSIQVRPEFRGRGHAKAALELLEGIATAEGVSHLALHVFSFNSSALALYRSLGYGITGMNMLKPLRHRDD